MNVLLLYIIWAPSEPNQENHGVKSWQERFAKGDHLFFGANAIKYVILLIQVLIQVLELAV